MPTMKKRRRSTSVKQILVRDFNWRMGNLRRFMYCIPSEVCPEDRDTIQRLVDRTMMQFKAAHERRIEAIADENINTAETHNMMTDDPVLANAVWQVQWNEWENNRG